MYLWVSMIMPPMAGMQNWQYANLEKDINSLYQTTKPFYYDLPILAAICAIVGPYPRA
jgi:hypothetical protein